MANPHANQSVTLDSFLGLVTNATPDSIPEGASPLNWDVDYTVGDVFTRPGLDQVYTLNDTFSGDPFFYIKSYPLSDGEVHTLALDASGQLWDENVITAPGLLTKLTPKVIPGSHAFSVTEDDVEYICFSDLSQGTDIPRQYNVHPSIRGYTLDRISQVGPGAPPSFNTTSGGAGTQATITSWVGVATIVTFQAVNTFIAGEVVTLSGFVTSTFFNGKVATVLGTGLSGTQFEISFTGYIGGSDTGLATPQFSYPIQSISQPGTHSTDDILWSAGPGSTNVGNVVTVYYTTSPPDNVLIQQFNSGIPTYVYITNGTYGNGTQLVTGVGQGTPPGAGAPRYYFTFTAIYSTYAQAHNGNANYQLTIATVVTKVAVPNLLAQQAVTISGATPGGWNNTWQVVQLLNSGNYTISQTSMTGGVATYTWAWAGSGIAIAPQSGQLVTVLGATNGNGIFNVTDAAIGTVTGGPSSGTFTITGFSSPSVAAAPENAQAETFGTKFQIDPGSLTVGTMTLPVYGNDNNTGVVVVTGSSPIASGTRQAIVFFETRNGYKTSCSAPVTFTTSQTGTAIVGNSIPIGPPNVIRRWLAFTPAGQNGIAGPNFYSIDADVTTTLNGANVRYTKTYIDDNITTTASFVFTDAVLLSGEEIDVQGNNLFNEIELGSSAWNIAYASRMFYGLEQNKVLNFTNTTFDGGYLPVSGGGAILPLGWRYDNVINTTSNVALVPSSVFGDAVYINNNSGSIQTNFGMLTQTAFQDAYNVPIILPNTLYSVRVYASIPSTNTNGTLIVDLTQSNAGLISGTGTATGYGITFGTYSLPFSQMTSVPAIFSGALLTSPFQTVPSGLVLRIWQKDIVNGADVKIERIEIYPTFQPVLATNVRVSYVDNFEAFDAVTGNIGLASHDTNPCFGAAIIHDQLYFLQSNSMQSTQDVPEIEPSGPGGGWPVHEVSNRVGACGIYAYDYGEEWILTACRNGIFGFNGGQPMRIDFQQKELWELINWRAGTSIILRNDLPNRRILCAVPLPTPNLWLPRAPVNPLPTFPNVMLMWNYQGLGSFGELMDGRAMHTTMFGTTAAVDMRLKMTIWQIPTHYMGFIEQADLTTLALVICGAQ